MGPFSMQSQDIPKWFSQQGSHNFYIATQGLRKPRQKLSSLLKACLKWAVSLRLYSIIKVVTDPMYWKREATSQQEECQRICRYLYSAIIHLLATRYSHSSCRRAHHTQASQESQLCSSKNTEAPPWGISSGPKDQWIKGTSQQPPTNCTMVRQRQITTIHTHLKKKKEARNMAVIGPQLFETQAGSSCPFLDQDPLLLLDIFSSLSLPSRLFFLPFETSP